MAFLQTEFFSHTLQMSVTADVILPQRTRNEVGTRTAAAQRNQIPVLWLLHGATDDHTTWQRKTSIERYAAPLGIAVVMPGVHLSSYADMVHGGAFYQYVTQELPVRMRQFFPLSDQRKDNFIAGNSMGGFGAMKIGISHSDRYAAIGCLSAGANNGIPSKNRERATSHAVWSHRQALNFDHQDMRGTIEDTWNMARENQHASVLPAIYHVCGTADILLEDARQTRDFFTSLEGNPYRYTYQEHAGAHNWEFWDIYIQDFLNFVVS